MTRAIIKWSAENRFTVLLATAALVLLDDDGDRQRGLFGQQSVAECSQLENPIIDP